MKNVSLIAQLEGETCGTSKDVTGQKYYPKGTSKTKYVGATSSVIV